VTLQDFLQMDWASGASEVCLLSTDLQAIAAENSAAVLTSSAESPGAARACASVCHESGNGMAMCVTLQDFLQMDWASGASEVCLLSTDLQASAECCGDCPARSAKGAAARGCAAQRRSRGADSLSQCRG